MSTVRLLSALAPWRWFARCRCPRPAAAAPTCIAGVDAWPTLQCDDDVPRGCAWYPSSFELAQGIDVREADAATLVAA